MLEIKETEPVAGYWIVDRGRYNLEKGFQNSAP